MQLEMCPCGSKKRYSECCSPYINNDVSAPTAETLMRSRYSAYVIGNIDYIINTSLKVNRYEKQYEDIASWISSSDFYRLDIVDVRNGLLADNSCVVHFEAHYKSQRQFFIHQEVSQFIKEEGTWFYQDALKIQNIEQEVKRNDPCLCGSGKKYKKCCA